MMNEVLVVDLFTSCAAETEHCNETIARLYIQRISNSNTLLRCIVAI